MTEDKRVAYAKSVVAGFVTSWLQETKAKLDRIQGIPYLISRDIPLYYSGLVSPDEPLEWLAMGLYALQVEDGEPDIILGICDDLERWIFADQFPPQSWYEDGGIGSLCAVARLRAFRESGVELVTLAEASRLTGKSLQSLGQRIIRGSLRAYINPASKGAAWGRRLVNKAQLVEVYGDKQ